MIIIKSILNNFQLILLYLNMGLSECNSIKFSAKN